MSNMQNALALASCKFQIFFRSLCLAALSAFALIPILLHIVFFFGTEVWTMMIFWLLIENLCDSVCFERHCSGNLLCLSECRSNEKFPYVLDLLHFWRVIKRSCFFLFSLVHVRSTQFDADFLYINLSADVLWLTHRVQRSHCYVLTIMFIYVYIWIECSIQNGGDKKKNSFLARATCVELMQRIF